MIGLIFKCLLNTAMIILSGVVYRLGGACKYEENCKNLKWYHLLCESWIRDFGVSFLVSVMIYLKFGFNWWLILSWGLLYGALSSYNCWIKIKWLRWGLTGASYGLAILPFAISLFPLYGWSIIIESLIRVIILALGVGFIRIWNKPIWIWREDIVLENVCGLLTTSTLLIMWIR